MQVGDLITLMYEGEPLDSTGKAVGIVTCIDPEGFVDNEEVEVWWISHFAGYSNHSTWNLEVLSESR